MAATSSSINVTVSNSTPITGMGYGMPDGSPLASDNMEKINKVLSDTERVFEKFIRRIELPTNKEKDMYRGDVPRDISQQRSLLESMKPKTLDKPIEDTEKHLNSFGKGLFGSYEKFNLLNKALDGTVQYFNAMNTMAGSNQSNMGSNYAGMLNTQQQAVGGIGGELIGGGIGALISGGNPIIAMIGASVGSAVGKMVADKMSPAQSYDIGSAQTGRMLSNVLPPGSTSSSKALDPSFGSYMVTKSHALLTSHGQYQLNADNDQLSLGMGGREQMDQGFQPVVAYKLASMGVTTDKMRNAGSSLANIFALGGTNSNKDQQKFITALSDKSMSGGEVLSTLQRIEQLMSNKSISALDALNQVSSMQKFGDAASQNLVNFSNQPMVSQMTQELMAKSIGIDMTKLVSGDAASIKRLRAFTGGGIPKQGDLEDQAKMSWLESWMPNAREYMQMRPGNAGNTNGAKSPLDKVNSIDDISGNLSTPEQKAQQALQDTMKQSLGVVNLSANIVNVIGGSTGALPTGPNGQSAIGAKGSTLWSNIQAAAKNFGMNADVVKAIMTTESSGDPNQVNHNPKGDHVGLMQIGQTTLDSYNKANPNNQYTWAQMKSTFPNLEVGAWDLKRAYDRSNGNMNTALSHYNGAPVGSAAAAKYIGSVWGNYHPAEAHLMGNNVTTGNQ